jgi:putative ABC transport system permease protein
MIPIAYNLRNLKVRKATTIAAAGGLALVVFVFASVMMLVNGIDRTLGRSAGADIAIIMRKGSDAELSSSIDEQHVGLVSQQAEVARNPQGRPIGVGELVVVIILDKLGTDGGVSNVQVRGVPDNVLDLRPTVRVVDGRPAAPGTNEVVIGKAIRGRFKGLELGETFELKKNRPATVVGVFEDADGSSYESEIWGDVNSVRTAFGREGIVSAVRVKLVSPDRFDAFKTAVEQNRQLGLEVLEERDYYARQAQDLSIFFKVMGVVIAIFFAIGATIGAMITMHASIAHRQREIGTLRALGFSRFSILTSFLIESAILALFGGAAGAAASLLMGFVRFSTMNFASWSEIVFTFEPSPQIILSSLIFAAVMGIAGGFLPAVKASRLSPIQAMRA